ncbi:MAG: hypothetical protein M2R45_00953 [Verrucomicrobia subdivision 3 bacterium]|nr:hypothetical protein [Limisphaerales bacterium]MCS1414621.1 hypothetical protein [Limisphaerales bacterium]
MRTKTLLIAAVLGAMVIATASAQVASVNVVGYVNKPLNEGLSLITNPLSNGGNMASEIIPEAPGGTTIYLYDGGTFTSSVFLGGWNPDVALPVGVGFYIQVSEDTTITFIGEVQQNEASNKAIPAGLSIQGSIVPQEGTLGEKLEFPASVGDTAYKFDGTGFEIFTYFGVWTPEDPVLAVGDALFIDKMDAGDWNRDFAVTVN